MAIKRIVLWPHEVLTKVSEEVLSFEAPWLKPFVADLLETMYTAKGVGLAAVQVGVLQRIFVMDATLERTSPKVFINPVIQTYIDTAVEMDEACLSLPGVHEKALRYPELIVSYYDTNGDRHVEQLAGIEAQCVQHEIEHLDGKLFVETLSVVKRDIIRRKIQKTLRHMKQRKGR